MSVRLLTKQHLKFLSLKVGCTVRLSLHSSKCHIVGMEITLCDFGFVHPEIFARTLFSRIALKDIAYLRRSNSLLGHDLPISVTDRVISPFREDFLFTKLLRSFVKIKASRKFPNLQYL